MLCSVGVGTILTTYKQTLPSARVARLCRILGLIVYENVACLPSQDWFLVGFQTKLVKLENIWMWMVTRNVRNVVPARILSVTELDTISGTFSMSTFSKWLKEEMYMNHMLLALIKGKALGSYFHNLRLIYSKMNRYCSACMYRQHKKARYYTNVSCNTVCPWVFWNVLGISLCYLSIWSTVKVSHLEEK